jgi:acetate kinase
MKKSKLLKTNSRKVSTKTEPLILVFNVGSSSIKYTLFSQTNVVISQHIERITDKTRKSAFVHIMAHIDSLGQKPDIIAHRIVHGGPKYAQPTRITPKVMEYLDSISYLAPLHNIPELEIVKYCHTHGFKTQFAVFDTAFHRTIPKHTQMYPIPKKYYTAGIQKYGFHGISHEYISQGFKGRVITCHLGSGASICAIKNGISLQNSMGFTPLDGLMMGTRSGTIGMEVIPFLNTKYKLSLKEIEHILQKESGLLAIGGNNDLRDLLNVQKKSTISGKSAKLAIDMYIQRIIETIGSYIAVLGGVDTIIFSGGTGERSAYIRSRICNTFAFLNLVLDETQNQLAIEKRMKISSDKSTVSVYVVPTNEELAIAKKILHLV